ncbi:MAG: FtsX-like permease family protein [Candidatus Bathyarchaeia archaeon]
MKLADVFSFSFSAIRLRKLRAGLTTLGVVIGIAAIVALLSVTQGLQERISTQLQKGLATDTLIVTKGGGLGVGAGSSGGSGFRLWINYTENITGLSPEIDKSIAIIQRVGFISFNGTERSATITGIDFRDYADIYSSTFISESGTIPSTPTDETVVVGKRIWDFLNCSINDTVQIKWTNATNPFNPTNETYTGRVEASLQEIGGFGIGGPSDTGVYIPISYAQRFFGTEECEMIVVKLKSSDKPIIENVSKTITEAFNKQVSVISSTAILNIISNVFSILELFLGGIAAISLLVAGIGIMNIMIVSLMERTREIGLLKALGMKSQTVLLVFLCESIIIGLIGATIGIFSGWGLANLVALIFRGGGTISMGNQPVASNGMTITPVLTPNVILGALGFGIGVSVIFALYPAWRASKLKPVEALRYE